MHMPRTERLTEETAELENLRVQEKWPFAQDEENR
jgi:hypothetical protein